MIQITNLNNTRFLARLVCYLFFLPTVLYHNIAAQSNKLKLIDIVYMPELIAINKGFDAHLEASFIINNNHLLISKTGMDRSEYGKCEVNDYSGTFLISYAMQSNEIIDSQFFSFSTPVKNISDIWAKDSILIFVTSNEIIGLSLPNFPKLNQSKEIFNVSLNLFNLQYPRIFTKNDSILILISDQIGFYEFKNQTQFPKYCEFNLKNHRIENVTSLPTFSSIGMCNFANHSFYSYSYDRILYTDAIHYKLNFKEIKDTIWNYSTEIKLGKQINDSNLKYFEIDPPIQNVLDITRGANSIRRITPILDNSNKFVVNISSNLFTPKSYLCQFDLWEMTSNGPEQIEENYLSYPIRQDSLKWMNCYEHYMNFSCDYKLYSRYVIVYSNQLMNPVIAEMYLSEEPVPLEKYYAERKRLTTIETDVSPCIFIYEIVPTKP